jgi:hypothetical protein
MWENPRKLAQENSMTDPILEPTSAENDAMGDDLI